jgi:putative transposase
LVHELRAQGRCFNVKTISANLLRQGLQAKAARKFSPVSYREHRPPVSDNLLKQDFYASGPNQKWAGDIIYLRTDEGWLYLAMIIDLWSRAVRSVSRLTSSASRFFMALCFHFCQ